MATKVKTVERSFELKLQELYDMETQIEKALKKMVKKADTQELKQGFATHLEETKGQIDRLEKAFAAIDEKPKKHRLEGIRGILIDGEIVAETDAEPALKDSMLAGAARSVEHYEMAGYLAAIAQAKLLGEGEVVALLEENLAEEEATDKKLAQLSDVLATEAKAEARD